MGSAGAAELGGTRMRTGRPRRQRSPRAAVAGAHAHAAASAGDNKNNITILFILHFSAIFHSNRFSSEAVKEEQRNYLLHLYQNISTNVCKGDREYKFVQ